MNDNIKYTTERARNLSQELMLREDNELVGSDLKLCAAAIASYGAAVLEKRAAKSLDDLESRIVGYFAENTAADLRRSEEITFGPTDSEFCSRALAYYASELSAPAGV